MLLLEFDPIITNPEKIHIKYREANEKTDKIEWKYMFVDFQTLCQLIQLFGITSVIKLRPQTLIYHSESISDEIKLNYCGTNIRVSCGKDSGHKYNPYNNFPFSLRNVDIKEDVLNILTQKD